ncbi:P2RY1 protein, partial [Atractosteus spatula]|nr:P2RY1 protein [Atractosteus spatula]
MTNSSCKVINRRFTHVFLPAVYVLVFIIGFIANCWGLRHVIRNWKKMGKINVFVLNLGIADLLYVVTLPFLVAYYASNSEWMFGEVFCKVTRFCFHLNLYGSIGFLTCISVYRYLGIVHPMKIMGRITLRHSVGVCFVVWVLVIVQILPDMFFDKSYPQSSNACFDTTANHLLKLYMPYSIGWTVTGFGIPSLIILGCYGHVALVLSTKANINTLLKQRCLKLVVILTILFSVCFIPYHLLRNLNMKTRLLQLEGKCHESFNKIYISYQVSRALACMNSAMNPLIYLVSNDDFIMRFHDMSKRARRSVVQLRNVIHYRRPMNECDSPNTSKEYSS